MQAAQILASYTLGGADLLRRAMGKKIEEMVKRAGDVRGGMRLAEQIPAAKANRVSTCWRIRRVQFNKSHAAAYAVVAYQTAYLKANHPVGFSAR